MRLSNAVISSVMTPVSMELRHHDIIQHCNIFNAHIVYGEPVLLKECLIMAPQRMLDFMEKHALDELGEGAPTISSSVLVNVDIRKVVLFKCVVKRKEK